MSPILVEGATLFGDGHQKSGKMHCTDCLDEFGRCVACSDEEATPY